MLKRSLVLTVTLAVAACGSDSTGVGNGNGDGDGVAAEGFRYRATQAGAVINDSEAIYTSTGVQTATGVHEPGALNVWFHSPAAVAGGDADSVRVTYTVQSGAFDVEKISGSMDGTGFFAEWTQVNTVSSTTLTAGQSVTLTARQP